MLLHSSPNSGSVKVAATHIFENKFKGTGRVEIDENEDFPFILFYFLKFFDRLSYFNILSINVHDSLLPNYVQAMKEK